MRDNFRPNVRLATNILMVFGTFLIAINLASISRQVGKQDTEYIKRRDACADWLITKIDTKELLKVLGLKEQPNKFGERLDYYCTYYGLRKNFK